MGMNMRQFSCAVSDKNTEKSLLFNVIKNITCLWMESWLAPFHSNYCYSFAVKVINNSFPFFKGKFISRLFFPSTMCAVEIATLGYFNRRSNWRTVFKKPPFDKPVIIVVTFLSYHI